MVNTFLLKVERKCNLKKLILQPLLKSDRQAYYKTFNKVTF